MLRSRNALPTALFVLLLPFAIAATSFAAQGDCGQPLSNGSKPAASDCLHVLKSAVGSAECSCICDTDGSGSTVASDALLCLRVAVGQPLSLSCDCAEPIASTAFPVESGKAQHLCYYFRTPNTEDLAVRAFEASMSAVVAKAIVIFSVDAEGQPLDLEEPGVISEVDCSYARSSQSVRTHWIWQAVGDGDELVLPANDGSGKPLAIEVPANSAGYLHLLVVNATDETLPANVSIQARALPEGTAYTKTASYLGYDPSLNIPPGAVNDEETMDCNVPPATSIWYLTTRTHIYSVRTQILDGAEILFDSTNWEDPGAIVQSAAPFLHFDSGKIRSRCLYNNNSQRTITTGDNNLLDEQCLAVSYFFPATKSLLCVNGIGPF